MDSARFSNPMHRGSARASARDSCIVDPESLLSCDATDDAREKAYMYVESSATEIRQSAVHPGTEAEEATKEDRKKPCCLRCRLCIFELREYKIRGFRLPQFFGMLGSLVLPTADAGTDWSVIIKWYLDGDVHWASIGLSINLLSGALSGLFLVLMLA
eukprot:COSAG04_NODE_6824_length_1248_cov_1.704091_2_plen_157_part_01